MIIEFVGPPGVGKSTVCELAAAHLSVPFYEGKRLLGGGGHLAAMLRRPRLAVGAVMRGRGVQGRVEAAANLCRRDALASMLARENGTALLDGGPLQFVMMRTARGYAVLPLLRLVHQPAACVLLTAPPDLVAERLRQRGVDRADLADWAHACNKATRLLAAWVRCTVVEVNATGDPDAVAAQVTSTLLRDGPLSTML